MKNELLKNKISESIASKTVSDNLIYLSMAMIKYKDKSNKYIKNMTFLLNAAAKNGITKDIIKEKVNSITIENYTNCITINQALAISYICRDGKYTYDKNYLPDAVCGFVSDEECAFMLKDFGYTDIENSMLDCSDSEEIIGQCCDSSNRLNTKSKSADTVNTDTSLPSSSVQNDNKNRTITTLEIAEMMEIEKKDLEIYQKDNELSYKSNIIDGFVKDIGLADKRQIINRIIRHQGGNYDKRWRILYREFNNKFHIDIDRQMKSEF